MTQICSPHVQDGLEEPNLPDTFPNDQPLATDRSQDDIEWEEVSSSSSITQGRDAEPSTEINLEKSDMDEVRAQSSTTTNPDVAHAHLDPQYTPAHIEQDGPSSAEVMRPPKISPVGQLNKDAVDDRIPNIVIFGETGVGKSSIINLIADEDRAYTSNDALGCTFEHTRHVVNLGAMRCALWDTIGLDEGTQGAVPARLAENKLEVLISNLTRSGGIHLVIYCIRGARLTMALKRNYDLFYVTVCRKKVPVALVVTGLEHQQGDMESWWGENVAVLKRSGMWFDDHACVTTLNLNHAVIQERRLGSQRRLRELVVKYASKCPWDIGLPLMPWAAPILSHIPRDTSLMGRRTVRRVVIYDRTARPPHGTSKRIIGDRQLEYEWVHVNTRSSSAGPGRPGVLVFYTSQLGDDGISSKDVAQLKTFYEVAGGKTCPVIVVLRGCNDDEVVRTCWDDIVLSCGDMQAHCVGDVKGKLEDMVEWLCIEHNEDRTFSDLWREIVELFSGW